MSQRPAIRVRVHGDVSEYLDEREPSVLAIIARHQLPFDGTGFGGQVRDYWLWEPIPSDALAAACAELRSAGFELVVGDSCDV